MGFTRLIYHRSKTKSDSVDLNALCKNSAVVLGVLDEETEDINSERKTDKCKARSSTLQRLFLHCMY